MPMATRGCGSHMLMVPALLLLLLPEVLSGLLMIMVISAAYDLTKSLLLWVYRFHRSTVAVVQRSLLVREVDMAGELIDIIRDKATHDRVLAAIQSTIVASLKRDKARATQSEVKRRFNILIELLRALRAEGWAYPRICDALPTALRCKLDGVIWDPRLHRNSWTA